MKSLFIKSLLILLPFVPDTLLHAQITAEKTGSRIDVTINKKFFTSYIFSCEDKYPCFFPVNGPLSGGSVTSMRNSEYPHHSSLFFGCDQVNGGNFWQEGLERGRIVSLNAEIRKQGKDSAVITNECIWSRPGASPPVRDDRIIIITASSPAIYQIDFIIRLEMLEDVTIRKTNHSLFSARISADLSVKNGGTMINAEGRSGEMETFGKPSPWMDCYGRRGSYIEGIAILQHPDNPWYPSPWFTRDYGFFSPTPMYWPENGKEIFMPKGTVLNLKYRVLVHGGDYKQAAIGTEYRKYQAFSLRFL
jgi:hypothetical protein